MGKKQCVIGLVGGVGPWAGLDVHRKILEQSKHKKEQDAISIMHLSYPNHYSDRTAFLLGETDINPAHSFLDVLGFMDDSGVDVAAIVCNTAHAKPIISTIEKELDKSSLTYINIIQETCSLLSTNGIQKAGLLATLGTYKLRLYNEYFQGDLILPNKVEQQRVHDCIYHKDYGLKIHYPQRLEVVYEKLITVGSNLIDNGAEALILGCTELPLLKNLQNYFNVPVYDPNKILAEALYRASQARITNTLKTNLPQLNTLL